MQFSVSCRLDYEVSTPVTFLLSVRARAGHGQQLSREQLTFTPELHHTLKTCRATGTPFDQFHARSPGQYTIRYQAEVETTPDRMPAFSLHDGGTENFDPVSLPYLYPSRYCQSDRMGKLAFDEFGHLQGAEARIRAIVAWISHRLDYVSGSTSSATSAVDSLVERAGVCRDYAHLGIALCRAMNIPARYFTGYAHALHPPDFHACFETWTGNRWLIWDATGLASPDGLVRIATGRDAADCSVCTSFGPITLLDQEVHCTAVGGNCPRMSPEDIAGSVVSLTPPEV